MNIDELTRGIVEGLLKPSDRIPDDYAFVRDALKVLRNNTLYEAAEKVNGYHHPETLQGASSVILALKSK
jgi:hypothetical protein